MTLSLSTEDHARLATCLQALLSPLDQGGEAWAAALTRSAKALIRADMASMFMPLDGEDLFHSGEFARDLLGEYKARVQPLNERFAGLKRQVAQGAWTRESVWGPHREEYYRSEYYTDYIAPIRAFDAVGLTVSAGQDVESGPLAHLMFHHERQTGPRFSERDHALLRLLLPAFRAGVGTYWRFARHREQLARTLDALPHGILACGEGGKVLHRNAALLGMFVEDPEAACIEAQMRCVADALGRLAFRGSVEETAKGGLVRELRTARTDYRLRGSLAGEDVLRSGPTVLVSLERTTREPPAPQVLRERWGLTRKEAEVALLLRDGRSNGEIAKLLFISPHTARHHTEHILQKLGARSRAEVGTKILNS